MKARKTAVPADSSLWNLRPADYTDAFCCEVAGEIAVSPLELQVSFWTDMPGWVDALMKLRNLLVRPFGLQHDHTSLEELADAIRSGGSNGLMSLYRCDEREAVVRLSDKHLDAHLSVRLEKISGNTIVTVSTVVHYHNFLGKTYFLFIRPFHAIVVKSMVKNTVKRFL